MFRDFIRRLNKKFFWISKWIVTAAVLALVLLVGVVFLVRRDIDFDTFLNYFALGLLIFVVITLFYGIIAIHDVPYEIAKARDHPQQDAIHVAGWVSLFTLHVLWPFLWIWAMLYRPDRGWGFQHGSANAEVHAHADRLADLLSRVEVLEARSGAEVLRRETPITEQPPALKIVDPQ